MTEHEKLQRELEGDQAHLCRTICRLLTELATVKQQLQLNASRLKAVRKENRNTELNEWERMSATEKDGYIGIIPK